MSLLALVLAARAATITEADASRMVDDLAPLVEEAAGRTFVERPRIGIASRSAIAGRMRRSRRFSADDGGARDLADVLGIYLFGTQEIFLVSDSIERLFTAARYGPALLEPLTRCVVAHELVHALQHQRAAHSVEAEDEVARALLEGHADHVAGQVCGEGVAWLDRVQGLDVPASRSADDRIAFAYGYAEAFVRRLEEVAGRAGVWSLLEGAPPPRDLIARVGGTGLPGGWADPGILAPIGLAAGANPDGELRAEALAPWDALGQLAPRAGTLVGVGGLGWRSEVGEHQVQVLAFLLSDERAARRFLHARREEIRLPRFNTPVESGLVRQSQFGVLWKTRKAAGVDRTQAARMEVGGDRRYVEAWAARGRLLFGVAANDFHLKVSTVDAALAALVAMGWADVPTSEDLAEDDRRALLALGDAPPAPDAVAWSWRADQLVPAFTRGDWGACVAHVEATAADVPPRGRDRLLALGLECALNGRDLTAAMRLIDRVAEPASVPEDLRVVLAGHLGSAGRPTDVLAVLPATGTGELRRAVDGLRLEANVALGRLDEVERIVRIGVAPPDLRAWAAVELARAGRVTAARQALAAACPELDGAPRRACEEARRNLSR